MKLYKQIKYWFIRNFAAKDKVKLISDYPFRLGEVICVSYDLVNKKTTDAIYIGNGYAKPVHINPNKQNDEK